MKIALFQINPTLGKISENTKKIIKAIELAEQKSTDLVLFPECSLIGYHPFDLLERPELVRKQNKYLNSIVSRVGKNIAVIIGILRPNSAKLGRPYFNSAVLIHNRKIIRYFDKQLLPTGDVFDEARFIEPGQVVNNFFKWQGVNILITICEDIWAWPDKNGRSPYSSNPLKKLNQKCDLVINLSASPFFSKKNELRVYNVKKTAFKFKSPVIYLNLVGGQDEIIFDGQSFIVNNKGKVIKKMESFVEDSLFLDTKKMDSFQKAIPKKSLDIEIKNALVLGIQDFVKKNNFNQVHLGLSGGIDSALVACLAVEAIGPERVKTFALPGPFSAENSLVWAEQLAIKLKCQFSVFSINNIYQEMIRNLEVQWTDLKFGIVHENLQARLRGLYLMAYANKESSLLLSTSNKSEMATGYSTLYGDMCGGLAPIGDLTKKQVYRLSEIYQTQYKWIPIEIIDRAPSAELRPNQKDQDSLPPYDVLDKAVDRVVRQSLLAKSEVEKWLMDRLIKTEFKRWQAPPILKISSHAFGRGRRYPITNQFGEK